MICTIGDLLLDVVVRLDGPIARDTDTYGRTRVAPGGQAANVAAWIVALGGRSRLVAKRGDDAAGRILAEELSSRDVELLGPEPAGTTGTVVSIAAADGTRSMLTDRGVAPDLEPAELEASWIEGCSWLHVPAYSLVRRPIQDAALRAADLARGTGAQVSVDLSSTAALREAGVDHFGALLARLAPDLLFANEAEAELAGALTADVIVVKRGSRGCLLSGPEGEIELAAEPATVVDTTGAGDAFAAGFLVGGPEEALAAAARCVARMGAMP